MLCYNDNTIRNVVSILDTQSQNIKFTREILSQGWLSYFSTRDRVSNSEFNVKLCRKSRSKNMVHVKSAHPMTVKRAVLRNIYRTVEGVCTGQEEREESCILFPLRPAFQKADLNGNVPRQRHDRARHGQVRNSPEDKVCLQLPFLSDRATATVSVPVVSRFQQRCRHS